jgi:hypothetical protein
MAGFCVYLTRRCQVGRRSSRRTGRMPKTLSPRVDDGALIRRFGVGGWRIHFPRVRGRSRLGDTYLHRTWKNFLSIAELRVPL